MAEADTTRLVLGAVAGDAGCITRLRTATEEPSEVDDPAVWVVGGVLEGDPARLDRAWELATSRRDRQLVSIARARVEGDDDLVRALARDHLVDFPDSLLVAWLASGAAPRSGTEESAGGAGVEPV